MTHIQPIELLTLLGEAAEQLRQLEDQLRGKPEVLRVDSTCDIRPGPPPSIEWFVDAELSNGEALSWNLLIYNQANEWIIESGVRRVHRAGSDVEVELPTRYALDADLAPELTSATTLLVAAKGQLM